MDDNDGLAAWIRLCSTPGLGGESQRKLLAAFGLPEQVLGASLSSLRGVIGEKADLLFGNDQTPLVEATLEWAKQPGHTLLTLADSRYPARLLEIPDPPCLLYVRGQLEQLQKPSVAVVGSRNASVQGRQLAHAFAKALGEAGYSVISGLALGIDAAAHEGALQSRGKTLALIGTGADRLYPARNRSLAERIEQTGAIVSEFPLGTPALPANFPRRNRLISGLSRGVLVVEAALESGSLVTARLALEQGREVMAIPGSIHSPLARGCHRLIKQGAKLVETIEDILDEIGRLPLTQARMNEGTSSAHSVSGGISELSAEDANLLAHIPYESIFLDAIVARSNLPVSEVLARLLSLEMQGQIAALPGDCYQRISA